MVRSADGASEESGERRKDIKDLTPEQRKHIAECKTNEEALAYAREEGVEIPDEMLEHVAGGTFWGLFFPCPNCGSKAVLIYDGIAGCQDCGYEW